MYNGQEGENIVVVFKKVELIGIKAIKTKDNQ
jgi:hypothetical protein